jgi:hypothetical protein
MLDMGGIPARRPPITCGSREAAAVWGHASTTMTRPGETLARQSMAEFARMCNSSKNGRRGVCSVRTHAGVAGVQAANTTARLARSPIAHDSSPASPTSCAPRIPLQLMPLMLHAGHRRTRSGSKRTSGRRVLIRGLTRAPSVPHGVGLTLRTDGVLRSATPDPVSRAGDRASRPSDFVTDSPMLV